MGTVGTSQKMKRLCQPQQCGLRRNAQYQRNLVSTVLFHSPNSLLLGFLMQLEIWPPWCWLVWSVSWALKWSCLPLSPIVSGCLPLCGGWVLVGVAAFLGSEVVLSPVVSLHVVGGGWLVWPHLEQKYSEIKSTGFNRNLLTVNCLGSTLV